MDSVTRSLQSSLDRLRAALDGARRTLQDLPRRWSLLLRWAAALVAVTCTGLLTVGSVANETVLSASYYRAVLDDEHAYTRLYDQVLVDPQSAALTRDLLADLPVPRSQLLANLKVVLPPATVRRIVDAQITAAVAYIRGDRDTLVLRVDLTPVVDNITRLAQQYLGDLVASLQQRPAADFSGLIDSLDRALTALSQGRTIAEIPTIRLSAGEARTAADVLLRPVSGAARDRLRPVVLSALEAGDIGSALATVGPYVLTPRTSAAIRALLSRTGALSWDVEPVLARAGADVGALHTARSIARPVSLPAQVLTLLVGLLAFGVLWLAGVGAATTRRLVELGAVLLAGGVAALLGLVGLRALVADLVPPATAGWSPAVRQLVGDLRERATHTVTATGIVTALLPIAAGTLLVALPPAQHHWTRLGHVLRRRRRVAAVAVGAVVIATLVAETVTPSVGHRRDLVCLGSTALCHLRYDQAAFLATHNSMASTADRYLGPFQDPDMIGQLDQGARALLIDTHTWERSDQILARLRTSDFAPELRRRLPALIDSADPPRPGLWLCHVICRAGATALVPALERLGTWLDEHRDAVVTLLIEDDITGPQTEQAFRSAGLLRLIQTPPTDPAASWPTLGRMVRSDRRLVVFSQRTNGPAAWYRSFYDYGMETPFAVTSPEGLTCAPQRGGTDKRLFLLNDFVSADGSSRLAAAQVNRSSFVLDRVRACEAARGADVSFVAVDFATIGDAQAAVDSINLRRARDLSTGS